MLRLALIAGIFYLTAVGQTVPVASMDTASQFAVGLFITILLLPTLKRLFD